MFCALPSNRRRSLRIILCTSASVICLGAGPAFAQDESGVRRSVSHLSNEQLVDLVLRMDKRLRMLEERDAAAPARGSKAIASTGKKRRAPEPDASTPAGAETAAAAPADQAAPGYSILERRRAKAVETAAAGQKPVPGLEPYPGLIIGAYGEVKFGRLQNPDAGGMWQNKFDAARLVLLPTFAITDNIIFNAEIEFEHGGIAFEADDKLHGSVDIEQVFIDFKFSPYFNFRTPGIDLIPIGYINQHHEPTQFYSVNRPELYQKLIPSTWRAPATGFYGTLLDGLSYQFQVSQALEDFGDDFDLRTGANTVPLFPDPYAAGINGLEALGVSRTPVGDFSQLHNTYAISGRFDIAPPFIPGLAGSVSAYYTPNVTPRGAHGDLGNLLVRTSLTMFDAEVRYHMPDTGLELRAEYVRVDFGSPFNLRANNDTDPTNNVGKYMDGYSGEAAYHFPLGEIIGSNWEAVPFYRYTRKNLQQGGFSGTDLNLPTGAGQLQFHTAGIAVFPSPQVVLKASYQRVINKTLLGAQSDSVLGGVGFFF